MHKILVMMMNDYMDIEDFKYNPTPIGEGSFGTVYLLTNFKNEKRYAAKVLKFDENSDSRDQMNFLRESVIINKINHPAIVKFHGFDFTSLNDSGELRPTLILEYVSNGSLQELFNKEKLGLSYSKWNSTKKYIIILGIAKGMQYLHEHKINHRDLKPENILLDENYYPKICDFGLSKIAQKESEKMSDLVGTQLYMAPEILSGQEYNFKVDVFSYGILLYEIVTGLIPYKELGEKNSPYDFAQEVINGYRPKFDGFVTEKMKSLVKSCWSQNPEKRPTFDEIFKELSGNIKDYFIETIDEDEVNDYIDYLMEYEKDEKTNEKVSEEANYKEQINELKSKISKFENEEKQRLSSNDNLCSALSLILGQQNSNNYNEVINYLNKSSNQGNDCASFLLGLLYEKGEKVQQNYVKSFDCYLKSVEQGNKKGIHKIGQFYLNGFGVKKDVSRAVSFLEEASNLGVSDAMNDLGILYINGQGVKQSYQKAIELFEKALDLGNSDAMNCLGSCYENGLGVKIDFKKAAEFYEKSAKLDNSFALNNLGLLYAKGKGVEQDYSKAIDCYKKAADLGNHSSLNNLGLLYASGKGVEKDYSKAIEFYKKAADLGDPMSLYNMGVIYECGQGIDRNITKAMEYYEEAFKKGNLKAKEKIANIQRQTA